MSFKVRARKIFQDAIVKEDIEVEENSKNRIDEKLHVKDTEMFVEWKSTVYHDRCCNGVK
jgi:hypothetical protein